MNKPNLIKIVVLSIIMVIYGAISVFAYGWSMDTTGRWVCYDQEGYLYTNTIRSSGTDKFYLDDEGYMVTDFLLEDFNGSVYYFDDSGKMVRNTWVAVDPYQVEFAMENPPTIYLYYFGENGKGYKAKSSGVVRKIIDGKKYLFNENGQMLSGWIDETGARFNEYESMDDPFKGYIYYAGDETDGVLREGWMEFIDGSVDDRYYTKQSLYFYFRPTDSKKIYSTNSDEFIKKTINGLNYAFDENGVMIQGWDSDTVTSLGDTKYYFSEQQKDTGRMHKKEWVFAVPSAVQSQDDHDQDVQRWFYSNGGGEVLKNTMKKIDKGYYIFNEQGIMKHGLCIIDKQTRQYVDSIELERTDGKDFLFSRYYISSNNIDKETREYEYNIFDDKTQELYYFEADEEKNEFGLRKTGEVEVAFADGDYVFGSNSIGEYEGKKSKKYYQAGLSLRADPNLGLGLVLVGYSSDSEASGDSVRLSYNNSMSPYAIEDKNHYAIVDGVVQSDFVKTDYIVDMSPSWCQEHEAYPVFVIVDKNGKQYNKSFTYKKDKEGRYWLLGSNASFVKAYDVPIKYVKSESQWYFKSEFEIDESTSSVVTKTKSMYRPFDTPDVYGKTCTLGRDEPCDYEVRIDDTYATNFRFADNY